MCIISYKAAEAQFPSKKTLQRCFEHNPDGAGFMYTASGVVHIKKGFTTFQSFWKTLRSVRETEGDNIPYVMHFRISTQAGTRPDCTHPFPLSEHMKDLRLLDTTAKFGIAHNGIISLTSEYGYKKTITYSDTMKFITDYLSLIINGKNWYKNDRTTKLIERLMGSSRLAVLDSDGHCQLLGSGWVYDNGIWYSNTTYKTPKVKTYSSKDWWSTDKYSWSKDATKTEKYITKTDTEEEHEYADDVYDRAEANYNAFTGRYDLDPSDCPLYSMGDDMYCNMCSHMEKCFGVISRPYYDSSVYDDEFDGWSYYSAQNK